MPSFLKKLILGKTPSNPYLNPDHPNHTPQPPQPPYPTYPTYPQPAAHFPPYPDARPSSAPLLPQPHASPRGSSDFLAEARVIVGRDPVTGQPSHSRHAGAEGNPFVRGRDAVRGRSTPRGAGSGQAAGVSARAGEVPVPGGAREVQVEGRVYPVPGPQRGERGDVVAREERRRREEAALAAGMGGVEGYFAPRGQGVREFYGGA